LLAKDLNAQRSLKFSLSLHFPVGIPTAKTPSRRGYFAIDRKMKSLYTQGAKVDEVCPDSKFADGLDLQFTFAGALQIVCSLKEKIWLRSW
jgi:hypothetical protein